MDVKVETSKLFYKKIKELIFCQPQVEMSAFLQSRSVRFLYFLKFISIYYCPAGV